MRSLKIINRTHDALFEISWGKCLSKPLNYLNSEIIRARKITIARNKAHSALYMKLTLTLENILATTIAWLLRASSMCWPSQGPPWIWCSGITMVQVCKSWPGWPPLLTAGLHSGGAKPVQPEGHCSACLICAHLWRQLTSVFSSSYFEASHVQQWGKRTGSGLQWWWVAQSCKPN